MGGQRQADPKLDEGGDLDRRLQEAAYESQCVLRISYHPHRPHFPSAGTDALEKAKLASKTSKKTKT